MEDGNMLENTRKCRVCKKVFPLSLEFFPKRSEKCYRRECIECHKNFHSEYRKKNREKLNKKFKEYRDKNKNVISQRNRKAYLEKIEERKLYSKIYYENNKNKINKNRKNDLQASYSRYKSCAKKRKISFELTQEEFSLFWNKECSYCGSKIDTVGIDRVNNDLGYTKDNCVSCCKICNKMKLSLTLDEWYEHMYKILSLHSKQMSMA